MLGILLAAGFSLRFGAADKLLYPLPDGCPLGVAAGKNLIKAIPLTIAVVRPENQRLHGLLLEAGLQVVVCAEHEEEMADSLAAAVRFSAKFTESEGGFTIALADMPFIHPATIAAVADRVNAGSSIVVPTYRGQRGHPVGFSAKFRSELENLQGDVGARSILQRYPDAIHFLESDDAGILIDIDSPTDMPN